MMQFAQKIPKEQIVSQLATQLTWSHIIEVLPVKDPLAVEFYLQCRLLVDGEEIVFARK